LFASYRPREGATRRNLRSHARHAGRGVHARVSRAGTSLWIVDHRIKGICRRVVAEAQRSTKVRNPLLSRLAFSLSLSLFLSFGRLAKGPRARFLLRSVLLPDYYRGFIKPATLIASNCRNDDTDSYISHTCERSDHSR